MASINSANPVTTDSWDVYPGGEMYFHVRNPSDANSVVRVELGQSGRVERVSRRCACSCSSQKVSKIVATAVLAVGVLSTIACGVAHVAEKRFGEHFEVPNSNIPPQDFFHKIFSWLL